MGLPRLQVNEPGDEGSPKRFAQSFLYVEGEMIEAAFIVPYYLSGGQGGGCSATANYKRSCA
jgi:hypothetical protein